MVQRLTNWFDLFKYGIVAKEQRPDVAAWGTPTEVYDLVDVFTTVDGSFDPGPKEGSIPDWARNAYLDWWAMQGRYYYPPVGGATHLFSLVLKADGTPQPGKQHWYWTGGAERLVPPYGGLENWTKVNGEAPSGMSNLYIGGHESGYAPPNKGPWCICPMGLSDVLCFAGRYMGYHISTFAVWQARAYVPPTPPPPDPGSDPAIAHLHADLHALAEHLGLPL